MSDRIYSYDFPSCRCGFADVDSFGEGFVARDTWSGCLDAPDFMPQGSVNVLNRSHPKAYPRITVANRDINAGCAHPGTYADRGQS